jgi:Skp family chaperone for outer membrane proteins
MKNLVLLPLLMLAVHARAENFVISDTRDAYEQVTAIKALFADVNQRIQTIRTDYEKQVAPLTAELEKLRAQPGDTRKRKTELLVQIAALQKRAGDQQTAIGQANEKALAQIDAQISTIENELRKERNAIAVVRAQDAIYVRGDCECNITPELYKRLNTRLPKVALPLAPTAAK